MRRLVWVGNGFNVLPPTRTLTDVDARRDAGPAKRVDRAARDHLVHVFMRWTARPDTYIEVAENLASIVSHYAVEKHGPNGWARIADQWPVVPAVGARGHLGHLTTGPGA